MKQQWELLQKSPARMFLVVFIGWPTIFIIVSILTWTQLSVKAWAMILQTGAILGSILAASVYIRNRATHLGASGAFGLIFQALISLLLIWLPIGQAFGFLESESGGRLSPWLLVPIGATLFVAVWGIFRDLWWAYFLEAVILLSVVGLVIWVPREPRPSLPERFPGENWIPFLVQVIWVISGLNYVLGRGRRRWRDWRQTLGQ